VDLNGGNLESCITPDHPRTTVSVVSLATTDGSNVTSATAPKLYFHRLERIQRLPNGKILLPFRILPQKDVVLPFDGHEDVM